MEHSPGIPDLYTSRLAGSQSLQVYLDPGQPGFNELHATYVGADGKELPMRSLAVSPSEPGRARAGAPLEPRRLDAIGHFVADLSERGPGATASTSTGVAADGTTYQSDVTIPVS